MSCQYAQPPAFKYHQTFECQYQTLDRQTLTLSKYAIVPPDSETLTSDKEQESTPTPDSPAVEESDPQPSDDSPASTAGKSVSAIRIPVDVLFFSLFFSFLFSSF
ncbi:hypothetical protein ASPZODRAFT_129639 [Penicilliopsis zonata CBS 506.65]|uniref:Uncharacterized protein n=1 Tax=Penicilliopsis zonata CBS 506.65 TaxID=1073090 RepID=A0A1L9SQ69_9EURO|nr:hypothetical protein ASPZODRAFT_129639 [Penicilliopsis zonata CBS 506.65]OJJ49227.1 hypothetical protein ASPZODRAFT_129639 [Penicilliopsis zonata CBS 506.65]